MARQPGNFTYCAGVSYRQALCIPVKVVKPSLKLVKTAPDELLICDPITLKFVVSNTGTGIARNVNVKDDLPAGLETMDGEKSVLLDAGDLDEGESEEFVVNVKATKTGKYTNRATAMADGIAGVDSGATATTVLKPVLQLALSGPDSKFVGLKLDYKLAAKNTGDGIAKGTVVEQTIPDATTFLSASAGGEFSAGRITWDLGDMKPGDTKDLSFRVKAAQIATAKYSARATAECADAAAAAKDTVIKGIPAILLEVIDEEDPIEVGANLVYVIKVTNQGSATGTNIKMVATLEPAMEYIKAEGATKAALRGNQIIMAPLAGLAPKDKAEWRVTVKAVKAGDIRFKVTMTSDQLTRPVEETEATNLFED